MSVGSRLHFPRDPTRAASVAELLAWEQLFVETQRFRVITQTSLMYYRRHNSHDKTAPEADKRHATLTATLTRQAPI
eukprot:5846661-Amphidinium_carterae.1